MRLFELMVVFFYVVMSALNTNSAVMFVSGVLLASVVLVEMGHLVERKIEKLFNEFREIKERQNGRND